MAVKVGINGFGRIGRCFFRSVLNNPDMEVAAVNSAADARTMAHLLMYDSIHGRLAEKVEVTGDGFLINDKKVRVTSEKDPQNYPWRELGVEIIVESSGRLNDGKKAAVHLERGAKKVLITAPAKDVDAVIVMGVNNEIYKPTQNVISCASCTTNCLAPVAKVLHQKFGIVRGLMTTVHSYTNDQQILDRSHKDLRRARAAAMSIIPTTTGAAKAVGIVLPELEGKLNGMAMRVPTPNVSVVDLSVELARSTNKEEINAAMKEAAAGELKGILDYSEIPLVSIDFNGNPFSSIFDAPSTIVIDGVLAKIISWYDNEWGYANRVKDMISYMLNHGL